MRVVIAQEAKLAESGCYHLLTDERAASLCGSINEDSPFASDSFRTLPRSEAERRELDVCGRCSSIAENRPGEASTTVD